MSTKFLQCRYNFCNVSALSQSAIQQPFDSVVTVYNTITFRLYGYFFRKVDTKYQKTSKKYVAVILFCKKLILCTMLSPFRYQCVLLRAPKIQSTPSEPGWRKAQTHKAQTHKVQTHKSTGPQSIMLCGPANKYTC